MRFFSRKFIKPGDLNANGSLFGGKLLSWVDEEAYIYTCCQLDSKKVVTKYMSEIDFKNSAKKGDIIEIGLETISFGRTSLTIKCEVRNKLTKEPIITIDKIVFVQVDDAGKAVEHGKTSAPEV